MARSSLRYALALGAALTLAGCGGDSSKSTGPTAAVRQTPETPVAAPPAPATSQNPVIKGWRAARNDTIVAVELDTYDAQGDLFGGYADVNVNGESFRIPSMVLFPGENPSDPELNLTLYVKASPGYVVRTGIPVNFEVSVTDRAGHRSNTVRGFFVTETPQGQTNDGPAATHFNVEVKLGK